MPLLTHHVGHTPMTSRLTAFFVSFVVLVGTAWAGLLPGQDAYRIRRDAIGLPNGVSRSARDIVVQRPAPGTYVPGMVIVKTRQPHGVARQHTSIMSSPVNRDLMNLNVQEVNSMFPTLGDASVGTAVGLDRMYSVRYDAGTDPFDICARLMDNPDVEYAVPMPVHKLSFTPNDPRYGSQTWMGLMKVDKAWDVTKGASSVVIAIIDSGTDWKHEDLSANIWTNPKEIPNNNIDDDKNGLIDDYRGWDFVGNISAADAQQGIVRPDNDPAPGGTINDGTSHGTVVGGCASASTNNAKGVAGAGFNCRIIAIKCGSDNPGFGGILRGYNAIAYAADLGAHIINCSWGGPGIDAAAQDLVDYATAKGSLVVAASGNDGLNNDLYLQSPASLDGVLSVGASTAADRVSGFSNYGRNVDVYAPGENILSTYPNNQYRALSGTSFSSPLTAGIAGLVKAAHPDWTPEMIRAQIRGTVDPLVGATFDSRPLYWGRVNAERAVKVNASFTSGERMPGLVMKELAVGGSVSGRITTYERTTVRFTVKNVLHDASNVIITPVMLDPNVTYFGTPTISLGNIARNGEVSGTFDIQVKSSYPWYKSDIGIGLRIASGTYANYASIYVPVDLPTTNSYTSIVEQAGASWNLIDVSKDGTLYAAGTVFGQRAMVRITASGQGGYLTPPFVPTAVRSVSSTVALIGGLSNNVATISRTTNGGSSWSGINVSANLASVEGVFMFDASNGIAVGNPVSGKFGVVRTTNGGAAWTAVGTAPLSTGSERIVRGATAWRGDAIWFATSNNRVIYSLNKGQSWAQGSLGVSGASVVSIAFRDSTNGIILYRTGVSNDSPYRIASSVNGGSTWRAGAADLNLGLTPVGVNANTGHHLLIGSGGEVLGSDNNGGAWQTVLSMSAGTVASTHAMITSRPTLYFAGTTLGELEYRYSGPNGTKLPEFTTTLLNFGSMESGQNKTRTASVRNTGTSDITVSKFETVSDGATPADAFTITSQPKTTIASGGSISIPLRCAGTAPGTYNGKLRMTSDGTPSVVELALTAIVTPPVSVAEDVMAMGSATAWPNPATSELTIRAFVPMTVTLITASGELAARYDVQPGTSQIDVRSLPQGAYTLVMTHGAGMRSMPIVITR